MQGPCWDAALGGKLRARSRKGDQVQGANTVGNHMPLLKDWRNSSAKPDLLVAQRSQANERNGSLPFLSTLRHSISCSDAQRQSAAANSGDYFSLLRLPLNMITVKISRLKACSVYDKM